MPSKSAAQARLMAAAAHDAEFAAKAGVPQGVAEEFNGADQAKGTPMPERPAQPQAAGKQRANRVEAGRESAAKTKARVAAMRRRAQGA